MCFATNFVSLWRLLVDFCPPATPAPRVPGVPGRKYTTYPFIEIYQQINQMASEKLKLHRTISMPDPQTTQPALMKLASYHSIDSPTFKSKLSNKSCPEDEDDEKIQSLNNNLDDLFTRINALAEEVITQQKNKQPIIQIKSITDRPKPPANDKPKPIYVDKRVHKKSFEVVDIPKIVHQHPIKGLHIRQFQLGNTLGEGKFGQVIQCIHRETGMIYACKKIFKATIEQYGMQDQLLTQLSLLKRLSHPNIVKLYSCFTDQYHVFMMTEYVHGPSLDRMFGSEQSLVSSIIFQVIKALEYLHAKGIAHRDIKPENLLIENGVVKLVDFGWAASFVPQKPDTFCGTLDYKKKYDGSVDIWSLGILTFELLSGVVPFKDSMKNIHLRNIANCEKHKLIFPPAIGSEAQDFIRRLLKKEPLLRMTLPQALRHPFITKYPQVNMVPADIARLIKQN